MNRDRSSGDTPLRIDLNADLGEGYGAWRMGDDDAMLDVVTSANVACGYLASRACTSFGDSSTAPFDVLARI